MYYVPAAAGRVQAHLHVAAMGSDLRTTVQNAGSDDAIDSDPDTIMLMTEIISIGSV
jgi:hypothetical protein